MALPHITCWASCRPQDRAAFRSRFAEGFPPIPFEHITECRTHLPPRQNMPLAFARGMFAAMIGAEF
jgi:hypothetical protein